MKEILIEAMKLDGKYEVHYIEYNPGEWTYPCLITLERIERVINDHSVSQIRITLPNK